MTSVLGWEKPRKEQPDPHLTLLSSVPEETEGRVREPRQLNEGDAAATGGDVVADSKPKGPQRKSGRNSKD